MEIGRRKDVNGLARQGVNNLYDVKAAYQKIFNRSGELEILTRYYFQDNPYDEKRYSQKDVLMDANNFLTSLSKVPFVRGVRDEKEKRDMCLRIRNVKNLIHNAGVDFQVEQELLLKAESVIKRNI